MHAVPASFCGPQPAPQLQRRLCSRAAGFLGAKQLGLARQPLSLGAATRRRAAGRVAASAAQPLLRAASRLALRTLPANLLAGMFAAARAGRFGPIIVAGLLAYSVGVTLYAANTRRQVLAAAAAATSAPASVDAPPSASSSSGSGSLFASVSLSSADLAPESLAEAMAVATMEPPAAPAPEEPREPRSEVCRVCGGNGKVRRAGAGEGRV